MNSHSSTDTGGMTTNAINQPKIGMDSDTIHSALSATERERALERVKAHETVVTLGEQERDAGDPAQRIREGGSDIAIEADGRLFHKRTGS